MAPIIINAPTLKLQPIDIILQRPLKCEFSMHIKKWSASCIQEQLEAGALETKLDLSIGTLSNLVCVWFFEAWKIICSHFDMTRKEWKKCGLLRAFERSFKLLLWKKMPNVLFCKEGL